MTIKELIEKLEAETYKRAKEHKDFACTHFMLESWYKKLKEYEVFSAEFNVAYDSIYGFLYGLYAAFYITSEEHDQLINDLKSFLHIDEVIA